MVEILHEFWVEILTVIFMAGVIVCAVILGHKFRDFMDKRKAEKESAEEA